MFGKRMIIIISILFCATMVCNVIYAYAPITTNWPDEEESVEKIENVAKSIWGTTALIVQILSFAAVIFAGLRYMFTSAEGRADIKKEMSYLALGAILVFCTTTVINFIVNAASEIMGP